MIERRYIWRVFFVTLAVLCIWVGLGIRLAFLHLGPNQDLIRRIRSIRQKETKILVGRGRILDCAGNTLALDLPVKDVCADPKLIMENQKVEIVGSYLAKTLDLPRAPLAEKLQRKGRRFAYIKRRVPVDQVKRLQRMQLPGVFFRDGSLRNYPLGSVMCHVLGFSNHAGVGSAGVELQMDKYLKGRPGLRVSERDGRGREMYHRRSLEIAPQEGSDVYLTLDQNIQYIVEKALDKVVELHNAKGAWAVIERVRTGEVLAMASRPSFDLNEFGKTQPEKHKNRALGYVYEPGSTLKAAVIAAALNEGVVHVEDEIDCEQGTWHYHGRPLRDYHAYDRLSVADVLKKSSNIGAAKIALMLGKERLSSYLRSFSLGSKTMIDLPGEEVGILHDPSKWSAISITRVAMGHEIAVTALQMVNLFCSLANDGFLMRPYIIKRIETANGHLIRKASPEVLARPISKETSAVMRQLLARVVEEGGTGTRASLEEYRVAGKTGTAQKPIPGGYSDTAHMASFVGFLPADHPRLGLIVVVDDPQPLHTGGAVAAPVFKEISEQVVRYLDIPPDQNKSI